ncbi:MAG: tripartite tricarboxylate transporter TctB family protein [Oscillospiraceae bacterium]|nr:tripartite tricarboxylate transporter TctB family protein [Oscillospiraceae bacterium]
MKDKKMQWTDVGVVVVMYAICGYFFSETLKLKAESQTYPKFTIILLFGLTTLYLLQMIVCALKNGTESGKENFKDFQAKQFIGCLVATILYVIAINYLGFYISTVLFMAAVLLYLKVPYLHGAIAIVALVGLIYFAFGKFLGVRLPQGSLIKALTKMMK